ncbi:NAD(P)/FAD-dependent oxidoreductase [Streptomyces aidingensis]|uniref:Assimilatory nitrate reductase electron transfer subunit n=1 Tax=Streptomyces aidingensis TaxID=910347 RepID=A0A1I1FSE6_9ACTN|nr:FAD-dependent oxidoreductase [Streptomyces aidingensis]SFC02234.1 assimilatory nitrate reductase electron transfer subunit [Streptomyces aidingensis]
MSSETRVVIAGGGMAGARLAQQLAARAGFSVTVIGEEPHPAYNRVLLAEVLAGQYPAEVIALPGPPAGVTWRSGVRVVRVDRAERRVVCDDGSLAGYDVLVLATGSNPVLPPLRGLFEPEGHDLPEGVHPFRTMDDSLALGAAVRPGTRAVVIGGGLLGVSAARALAHRGAQVVLAQRGEQLMERQLDAAASALLRRHLGERGVEVHTECQVRAVLAGDGPGRPVRAVELADGYRLEADLVVLACGVRPRVGLAQAAGLEVRRGIVVDDRLRTADPRIHAIGDCAEHAGVLYGLAGAAQEQADVLARVLAEDADGRHGDGSGNGSGPGSPAARYTGTRALTRLTLAESPAGPAPAPLDLAAFGDTVPEPGDDVVHLADATRGAYRKLVVRGDRLKGGILLGDLGSVGVLARTWEGDEPLPSSPLLHLLTHDGGY